MSAVRNYYERYQEDGNTVRKLQPVRNPEYDRRREHQREEYERRQQRERQQQSRRLERNRGIDLITLLFFALALGFTVYMTLGYLNAQSTVRTMENDLTSMKKEVLRMQDENAAIADSIPTMSISEIYKIASEELGMVLAKDNQIINYDSKKPDYVQQYTDVPEGENSDILNEFLNK